MRLAGNAIPLALMAGSASAGEVPAVLMDMPIGMPMPPGTNKPCSPIVVLDIDKSGATWVNGKPVSRQQLGKATTDAIGGRAECERVFIRPDADTPYGDVLMVISLLKQAGIFMIGLIDTGYEDGR